MSFHLVNLPMSPFTTLLSICPKVKLIEFKDSSCLLEIEYKTSHLFVEHFKKPVVIKVDENCPFGMKDDDKGAFEKTAKILLNFDIALWLIDEDYFEVHVDFSLKKLQHLTHHPLKTSEGPFLGWQLTSDIFLREIKKSDLGATKTSEDFTMQAKELCPKIKFVFPFTKMTSSKETIFRPSMALSTHKTDPCHEKDFLLKKLSAVFFGSGRFF